MTIVFVCTGNTCRSPLAVAAWRADAPPELKSVEVLSAGLAAQSGQGAARNSVAVAKTWGVDLSSHRARLLDEKLVARADIICTMTQDAAFAVRAYFTAPNVRVLGEFASEREDDERLSSLLEENIAVAPDISDPFGGSLEHYETCGAEIRRAVRGLITAVRTGEISK